VCVRVESKTLGFTWGGKCRGVRKTSFSSVIASRNATRQQNKTPPGQLGLPRLVTQLLLSWYTQPIGNSKVDVRTRPIIVANKE
jgi:hypothetical protein